MLADDGHQAVARGNQVVALGGRPAEQQNDGAIEKRASGINILGDVVVNRPEQPHGGAERDQRHSLTAHYEPPAPIPECRHSDADRSFHADLSGSPGSSPKVLSTM